VERGEAREEGPSASVDNMVSRVLRRKRKVPWLKKKKSRGKNPLCMKPGDLKRKKTLVAEEKGGHNSPVVT